MIYILTLVVLLYLVFYYDVNGNTRNRMTAYYLLMAWFIAVSGFQYCMGSDIIVYMDEFDYADWSDISTDNILGLYKRQFGWVLLTNVVKSLCSDFFLLKFIQAVFVNVVFFDFFKKQSNAIFTCVLFYSLLVYLDFNFNLLRQTFAIAIFLLGYRFFVEKKWFKYYFSVFLAILFHNSAFILFFIPLLHLLKINKMNLIIISSMFFLLLFSIRFLSLSSLFNNYLMLLFNDSDVSEIGAGYLNDDVYGQNTVAIIPFLVFTSLYLWIVFYYYKFIIQTNEDSKNIEKGISSLKFFLLYILLYVLVFSMPIFARFSFYFVPFFIIMISNFIINLSNVNYSTIRATLIVVVLIFVYSYPQLSSLFKRNTITNSQNIVQYYPYSSIFKKNIPDERYDFW